MGVRFSAGDFCFVDHPFPYLHFLQYLFNQKFKPCPCNTEVRGNSIPPLVFVGGLNCSETGIFHKLVIQ